MSQEILDKEINVKLTVRDIWLISEVFQNKWENMDIGSEIEDQESESHIGSIFVFFTELYKKEIKGH